MKNKINITSGGEGGRLVVPANKGLAPKLVVTALTLAPNKKKKL